MAVKQGQRTDKLSFIGGFNTEANPVNFPPDYTIDEFNFEESKAKFPIDFTASSRFLVNKSILLVGTDFPFSS